MNQFLAHVSLVVRDYDEAIAFFTEKLNFTLVEDSIIAKQSKRWVTVAPPQASGSTGATLLLAKASNEKQAAAVGNQSGGRVFLFLATDDFQRDYRRMRDRGVVFVSEPEGHDYGTVAVFEDLYGNLWDLIQHKPSLPG